jgi:DNA polymerase-3 subunit gamma/tau
MSYQVIARKWRPLTFAEVVGQQHVTRTLQNAIRENRVAHAYIFSGARGVGKTTTARILEKALNCAKGPTPEPCNECDSCREVAAGNALDVLEIDAASNRGIDQVRELRDMVRYAPAGGRYKVVLLDEAHMLTTDASNALLKTLEEPPDKVVFIMATTEPDKLADTIRSRSQHFHFRALSFAEINDALAAISKKENLEAEPGALAVLARAADGSLRDGLSLLEQARAYSGDRVSETQVRELLGLAGAEILDELVGAIEARSADRALTLVHRLLSEGQNLQQFCRETIGHFRNVLVARVAGVESDLITAPAEERPRLARAAAAFSEEDLTRYFQILLETDNDVRHKPDPRLHLEMGLLRMVNATRLAPLEQVIAELSGNAPPRPATNAGAGLTAGSEKSVTAAPRATAAAVAAGAYNSAASASIVQPVAPAARPAPITRTAASAPPIETPAQISAPAPAPASAAAATTGPAEPAAASVIGLEAAQVEAIKSSVATQQKFLASLVEHAHRWELEGGEIRLYFPTESRSLADMLQSRDSMEKLRTHASRVLGHPVRVCVKLEAAPVSDNTGGSSAVRPESNPRELRARFEQDPIVRGMLERFGGKISEVKARGEE